MPTQGLSSDGASDTGCLAISLATVTIRGKRVDAGKHLKDVQARHNALTNRTNDKGRKAPLVR